MIVLNLKCNNAHSFEGWFNSVGDFDHQAKTSMVSCPLCGDSQVMRLPSGPRVVKSGEEAIETGQQLMTQMMRTLSDMATNSEDVAERFPEEARRIHYGEAEQRNIRGQATLAETRDLLEEGIAILPVPLPIKKDVH